MPKKKINKTETRESGDEEAPVGGEEAVVDSAILEDTFTEEFSEYNDVDNF